jgi:hypothetical protein
MQDYNINVNYNNVGSTTKQTSPNYQKTQIKKETQVQTEESNSGGIGFNRAAALGLGAAIKINQYVGELTENTVTQRKRQVGITFAGMGVLAISHPAIALAAFASYVGNAAIQYNIMAYKENLTADFMKSLSGGVYSTRK